MRFYTSDLHFQHAKIQEYCPGRKVLGPDISAMNEALIRRYNEVVGPEDEVYIIGDFCMGARDNVPEFVRRLNGVKYLVLGNHDYKKPGVIYPQILAAGFAGVHEALCLNVDGLQLYLCHEPERAIQVVGEVDYFMVGHVHQSFDRASYVPHNPGQTATTGFPGHFEPDPQGKILNVGVDVSDYRPMTLEQLLARPHVVGKPHRI